MKLIILFILNFSYGNLFSQTEVEFYKDFSDKFSFSDYQINKKCELGIISDTIIWNDLKKLPNYLKRDLEKQFKDESNQFLSCYRYLKWGCGTACQMFAVVDYHTGEILDVLNSSLGIELKLNSQLVILNPPSDNIMDKNYRKTFGDPVAYEFKNGKFIEIKN